MEKVRLGIVGTGRMAQDFASSLPHAPGIELVAVSSRRQETADQFASRFKVPNAVVGLDALLAIPDVDLVYIASPHAMHCDETLRSLEAGKHVLCEKPFAINAAQARRMVDLARAKKLFLMEAMWTRYIPAVVRLREMLAEGVIGKVQLLVSGGGFIPPFDPENYLFRPDLGGGVLLDAGIYLVSYASMVFGSPSRIHASALLGITGVDDHDAFLLEHPNGEFANLYVSLRAKRSPDVLLIGEKGSIHMHPPLFVPSAMTLKLTGQEDATIAMPFEGNGYQFEAIEAARCIRAGLLESPVMPLDESVSILETMDEMRRQFGLKYPME